MPRQGHKLTINTVGKQLIATCECGQWRRALPLPNGADLVNLVGVLTAKHDRHVDRLGRPPSADASADNLPTLPDDPPEQ